MQVLICDDDEIGLDILEHLLVEQGFDVLRAGDGRAALEILRGGDCRLVISDWEMPGMSGVELCQAIRDGDFGSYIYVILLTSRDRSEDIVAGLGAGADDFMT
jgi:DNA-binding response OmpR family regulator